MKNGTSLVKSLTACSIAMVEGDMVVTSARVMSEDGSAVGMTESEGLTT